MWQRFTFTDLRVIGHYLGVLVMMLAVAMCAPLVTACVMREWEPASHYLLSIGIALVIGSALRLAYVQKARLNGQRALVVTGVSWFALALVGAIPLMLSGHYSSYFDALFDSVSAFTTTGVTLAHNVDYFSYADQMWRFTMAAIGGLGLVVVALSLGIFGKMSTSRLYLSEGRIEHVVPNVVNTTRIIVRLTVVMVAGGTIVLTILCAIKGMEPVHAFFHGLWLAAAGFVTAGTSPMSSSIIYYHSAGIEFVLAVLMLCGSLNFALYAGLSRGDVRSFFKDTELKCAFIVIAVLLVAFVLALCSSTTFSSVTEIARRGVFMLIAAVTTTGYSVLTTNQLFATLPSGALMVLAVGMAIGMCAGSTSGGIKIHRVAIIFKSISATVKQALSPDSARVKASYYHMSRQVLDDAAVKEALTVFSLYVITYVLGTLAGVAYGYDALSAMVESISMTSCGGISAGISSPGMPPALETVYMLQMWAGRLEFITLIAVVVKTIVSVRPRKGALRELIHR